MVVIDRTIFPGHARLVSRALPKRLKAVVLIVELAESH
jgi:hypothetical protein